MLSPLLRSQARVELPGGRMAWVASRSLALGGLISMGLGVYFGFLRPPLLPEDLRYMGASLAQIQSAAPGLLPWLSRVFGVLGGYMFATGLLTIFVAATSLRPGKPGATLIVAASGSASIGWMAIANFLIDSDFKWLLLVFALPWVIALSLTWASGGTASPPRRDKAPLDPDY